MTTLRHHLQVNQFGGVEYCHHMIQHLEVSSFTYSKTTKRIADLRKYWALTTLPRNNHQSTRPPITQQKTHHLPTNQVHHPGNSWWPFWDGEWKRDPNSRGFGALQRLGSFSRSPAAWITEGAEDSCCFCQVGMAVTQNDKKNPGTIDLYEYDTLMKR